MTRTTNRDVYFSFFMFTADLRPDEREYTKLIIRHIHEMTALGYTGFDVPVAPPPTGVLDHGREIESYLKLKRALTDAGLGHVRFTTNVFVTRTFDPSSIYKEQRERGLAYLKSRVDITAALGGEIMAGPIVFPYGVFAFTDADLAIWSDALQEWVKPRYLGAQSTFEELGKYAHERGVKLAIEPVDHWETPAPNLVTDVMRFLDNVPNRQVGVCIDSSHVVLGSDGPAVFNEEVRRASEERRLHYVQVSAPDRGAVHDSWIPWRPFLDAVLPRYDGPILVEIFNAIPVFVNRLRVTRRKFWIPGEDPPEANYPNAYAVARAAIAAVRQEISESADLIRGGQERTDYRGQ